MRRQPENAISEQARRFNAPILNEVMDGEDYPAIKAACEGRQLPAYEAASEFISQVAGNLDELLAKASGKKGALNTLERLERKRDISMEELQKLMKQIAQAGPEQLPELEKQAVKAANQAQSQINQTEAVGRMIRDQMIQNKEAVSGYIAQAVRAAALKAESASSALLSWGYGADNNDPERRAADLELAARVGKSPTLMEVARYLGRGLALIIDVLNPEVIILGSIFGRSRDLIEPYMLEVVLREAIGFSAAKCRIVPAGLGEHIGDMAALVLAVEASKKP